MYQYLKAIGFGKIKTRKQLKELLRFAKDNFDRKDSFPINDQELLTIYEKDCGEAVGISVIEIADQEEYREILSFFPYVRGMNYLFHENPDFEKFSKDYEYACICDENNLGIPLIFHVNNIIEYLKKTNGIDKEEFNSMVLSGLSAKGMIILPIEKDEYQIKKEQKGNELRNQMIDAAKAGDVEAMEQLTLEDMDTYTLVSNRSKREDIFTIVNSYFMPYTVECDKYSVLGDIMDVTEMKNKFTGEEFYYISLECNSIQIEFTIAKSDMIGVPEKGRRFKGYVWLQGEVDCLQQKAEEKGQRV